jgi:PAS domain S-box-containing protein
MASDELDREIEAALHAAASTAADHGALSGVREHLGLALRELRRVRGKPAGDPPPAAAPDASALSDEQRVNRELFDAAADAGIRVDASGLIVLANRQAEKCFGYGPGELAGQSVEVLIPERFRDRHEHRRATYVESPWLREMGLGLELYGIRKDGSEFPAEISLFPMHVGDEVVTTVLVRDTSERRRLERELRLSEAHHRSLAERGPLLSSIADARGNLVEINERWSHFTGASLAEIMAGGLGQFIHPDDLEAARSAWLRGRDAGEYVEAQARLKSAAGEWVMHLIRAVPVRDGRGELEAWVANWIDIEERMRMEAKLRSTDLELSRRLAELEALLDIVPIGIAIAEDPVGEQIRGNRAFNAMLRAPAGANTSKSAPAGEAPTWFRVFRDGSEVPNDELPIQMAAATGQPVLRQQIDIVFTDGSTTSLFGQAVPLLDEDGATRGAIGAFTDITEIKEVEEALRAANQAKDEFLGLVSHELKTPMTIILGNALLLSRATTEEDRLAMAADIRQEAERLHQIIENMLALARVDAGSSIEPEPVAVRRLTDRVVASHRTRHPWRQITTTYEDGLPAALAVPTYVEQVLVNFLNNAEKYSAKDTPIDVVARTRGGYVHVAVLDRGAGIPADEADAVFSPFYRSSRTADTASGFGIGLAVCKRLVEAQDGRIWLLPRPGGGSEFGFSLPVADET